MAVQTIPALDDIPEYPQRKDPQDRFDTLIKEAVDGGSKAVSELNTKFIPAYNSAVPVMNWIEQNKTELLAVDDNAASALASKNAAAASAATATTKAGEAATSATAAKASETAALAAQKAAEASASTATTRAEEAASSASTALASKDAAKTSETAAAASASTASTKAGEASDSATAAKDSETSALASAETAANSATVAQAAKAAAEAARDEAQDIANVGYAAENHAGLAKVDGKTTQADAGGVITVKDVAIGGDLGDLASARGQIGNSKAQGSHNFSSGMLSEKPGMYTAINSGSTNAPFTGPFAEMILGTPTYRGSLLITSGRSSLPRAAISAINMTEEGGFSGYNRLITEQQVGDGLTVTNGIISVPEMQGATASTSGTSGLVPPAAAGQQESFLTGGGEYKHITSLGPVSEKSQDLGTISGAVTIDLSAGLSVIATVGGATTLAFANAPAGGTATVLLRLTNGGAYTVTWPSTIKWPGGNAPTLTASGVDLVILATSDGGATWWGVANTGYAG